MFLAHDSFIDSGYSKKTHHNLNRLAVLIMGGLVLVLLLTLLGLAMAPLGEQLDNDDSSFLALVTTNGSIGRLFSVSMLLGLELGVFVTIMRLEYLQSHIGEKRPSNQTVKSNKFSFHGFFSLTALWYRAVFFLFFLPHSW